LDLHYAEDLPYAVDWHYAENGRQVGPVSGEELRQLARTGVVTPDTLIWRAGMPEWKPFREAGPGVPPPLKADFAAGQRPCNSCGRFFAEGDLAMFGETSICTDCKPVWVQRLRQGMIATTPVVHRYAGFWIRVVAQFIDGVIASAVIGTAFFLFYGSSLLAAMAKVAAASAQGDQPDPAVMLELMAPIMSSIGVFQLMALAGTLAYSVYFLVKFGATPGKMAVGIRVIRVDGRPIQPGQAIGRYFAHMLSGIIFYIGYMMAGWDEQKRALHDRLVDTRVVYK
jgi:uncharacterized RDD family membrane protein YckC